MFPTSVLSDGTSLNYVYQNCIHTVYLCIYMCGHVCAKIRLFLYVTTCPRKGPIPDTAAGQCPLRATAQGLQQSGSCCEDGRVGMQTQTLCTSAKDCLKRVIQRFLVAPSVSWNQSVWIWWHLFTSLEASWCFLKNHTQTHIVSNMFSSGNDLFAGGFKIDSVDKS